MSEWETEGEKRKEVLDEKKREEEGIKSVLPLEIKSTVSSIGYTNTCLPLPANVDMDSQGANLVRNGKQRRQ